MTLQIVQEPTADDVLSRSPFALVCGMVLQEEVPVDSAFAGPAKIQQRLGTLDPAVIATTPPDDFAALCVAEPPVHPFAESMSVLVQAAARNIVAQYGGDTAAIWQTADSGEHLLSRLTALPGFDKRKSQMLVALLGKQLGVCPPGWEAAAGPYGRPGSFRSVADVRDPQSLQKVRAESNTSFIDIESKGSTVTTDDISGDITEDTTSNEGAGAPVAKKGGKKAAAKKAAKRAANRERRKEEELHDPEAAARRAAKRAERRAARQASGETGGKGGGRRGRKRAASRGAGDESTASSAVPDGDAGTSGTSAPTDGSVPSEGTPSGIL